MNVRVTADELTELASVALQRAGASPSMAAATARALVAADMDGLPTHGVSRVAQYVQHLHEGRANGGAQARIISEKGATCLIDAGGGLAYEATALAASEGIKRATQFGVSFCGITNSHHFGAAAYHLVPVARVNMVGLAFSNSPAAINPWGGKKPLFGPDPVAAMFPRKHAEPLVIDTSLTEVTRGQIMLAAKQGKPIPVGWALDKDGNPTTDPKSALTGSLFAIGGVKGTVLALMVELVCAALTGAAFGYENDSYFEPGGKQRIGHAIVVIDPSPLVGRDAYFERVETLVEAILADGGVRLPGDRRHDYHRNANANGIEVTDTQLEELRELAGKKMSTYTAS